jgi:KDO2-lipid IV(A) lauroyltransferase
MKAISFYLTLPLLYLISAMPLWLLYGVCDVIFVLLYFVIGYRKKVVFENLRNSFPEKTEKEIHQLARKFYRYLVDLMLETFKTLTVSKRKANQLCQFSPEAKAIFDRFAAENKNIIIVMGHYGNWEWAGNTFSLNCKQQLYVIYHPLRNPYFNNLIIKMRHRFGTKLIPISDTTKEMVKNRHTLNATAFIADQTPKPENACWLEFLNPDTPVFWGTERIAQKLDLPIVFISIHRKKRGQYIIEAEVLFEHPAQTTEGEITRRHTAKLEADIRKQPEIWLWSHRRWKHKRPAPVAQD